MTTIGNPVNDPLLPLIEYVPIGVVMIGKDGLIKRVNPIFCEFIGYTEAELLQMNVHDFTHPDDRELSQNRVSAIEHSSSTFKLEKRYLHKEGHVIWGLVQGLKKTSSDGSPEQPYYVGFIQDITQLKRQEEELRATKEKYESLIHNSSDAIVIYDLEGHVMKINEAFTHMFGWQEHDVLGVQLPITPPDRLQNVQEIIRKVVSGEIIHNMEMVKMCKDGTLLETSMSLSPIRSAQENVIMLAAIFRDITLQKALWLQAKEQEESYKQLLANWPDAFMILKQGVWVYSNPAGLLLLGAERDEQVIGRSVFEFHQADEYEHIQLKISQVLQGEIHRSELQKFKRLDGKIIDVEVTRIPAVYEQEPAIHVLIRDVTERVKTEELMRVSDKLNAVGQLAAGIAHEIRNPLTAINGFVQLMQTRYPEAHHYFDIIKSEVERIDSITSELLLLAKPSLKSSMAEDVCELLNQVCPLLETQGIMSNVQIIRDYKVAPLPVMCDANQLKQVFINLLKNAIEAMPAGGQIKIVADLEGDEIQITIIDQGPGIPIELMNRIGQPFYTTKPNGTGLGLVVSYNIVQNHGGSITIANMQNEGAAFTIKLPCVRKEV
ncbi:PAS domain S-box protein [Paenibacillus sedimenti]|uniref:histidine kinase n=1 Tax=Paenibacillus sedimenti TaxID=2770274 RepID=A0A926KNG7_9BACL|nr:PAS domain S-box protein [Paenibacillus sedimenti]MBD0380001.1 PAS domain S-box protein [Paenibacillus sedimenti]